MDSSVPGQHHPGKPDRPNRETHHAGLLGSEQPRDDLSGSNNFKASYAWPMKDANFSSRTDWNVSDKVKVFGRYSQFRTTLDQDDYTPNHSPAVPNDNGGIMNSRNVAGDLV